MTKDEILEKVRSIVSEQLCLELATVTAAANFSSELGADSLDVVELVMALEEGFDIDIPDQAAIDIATVQDAVDFIAKELDVSE
ncbi:unnamed protein product [Chrysoparadoxa australica]